MGVLVFLDRKTSLPVNRVKGLNKRRNATETSYYKPTAEDTKDLDELTRRREGYEALHPCGWEDE